MKWVTQSSVVPSQPGICVSYTSPAYDWKRLERVPGNKVRLNVGRHYDIRNEFGGIGRWVPADLNGTLYDTQEQAEAVAIKRGYLQPFYKKAWRKM